MTGIVLIPVKLESESLLITIDPDMSPGVDGVDADKVNEPDSPGAKVSADVDSWPKGVHEAELASNCTVPVVPPSVDGSPRIIAFQIPGVGLATWVSPKLLTP